MITARNYAAQAQADLLEWADVYLERGWKRDAAAVNEMAAQIGRSAHFALPDEGKLLDDHFRGLTGLPARLPFPRTTIEWSGKEEIALYDGDGAEAFQLDTPSSVLSIDGRMVLAIDTEDEVYGLPGGGIYVTAAMRRTGPAPTHESPIRWRPFWGGVFIPRQWEHPLEELHPMHERIRLITSEGREVTVVVAPGIFLRDCAQASDGVGGQYTGDPGLWAAALDGLKREVCSVLELCEALACSNVKAESIPESVVTDKVRKARARDGKLPIFETKILTVEVPGSRGASADKGGTHSSPRQHLRRGHVRRLPPDHVRRIWVNSCVVGSAEHGRIRKSYEVAASE